MPHPMFSDDMLEIVESFVVETNEIFERLDNDLLALEKRPDDVDLLNGIFRAVHTVKGTAGFLSFEQMSILAHHVEDVLNKLQRRDLVFEPAMMDIMLEAFDLMKALLRQVVDRHIESLNLSPVIHRLKHLSRDEVSADTQYGGLAEPKTDLDPEPETQPVQHTKRSGEGGPEPSVPTKTERQAETTIRVEVDRLDHLMNLVGELVLGRNRLAQATSDLEHGHREDALRALVDARSQIDFITAELQSAVMKTRMVPIGRLFSRFPRVLRDIAREFSKEIELVTEGEDTEMDKSLVEEIADPLVHLIRNAADHGIESPEERRRRGKPSCGRLRLAAVQQGNHVAIEIEDDGNGLDPEELRRKAIEMGLVTAEEAATLNQAAAYNLIFKPGFSTARQLSTISGRGVGMDVVKTNVTRLNGTVAIDSEVGRGTRFTIKLPLTLAIIKGLLVCVGKETFAIPLHAVVEAVRTGPDEIQVVDGGEVIRLHERVLPLVYLADVLHVPGVDAGAERPHRSSVVVINCGNQMFGVVADHLVGQAEVVIKPPGNHLNAVPGIAGSTVLGDGRVVWIVDPGRLVDLIQRTVERPAHHRALAAAN